MMMIMVSYLFPLVCAVYNLLCVCSCSVNDDDNGELIICYLFPLVCAVL